MSTRPATPREPHAGRPRLQDVAARAGVSAMTVVRVLREPAKVAARTRERVERVIAKLGYTPDLVARGLASNRSGLVAAIIPVLTNSLIAEIMQGLADAIAPDGYHLLLGASGFSAAGEEALVRAFLSRRIDGLYLTGAQHTRETARLCERAGIPVVEGGNLTRKPLDMVVGYSNVEAARTMTRYLVAQYEGPVAYLGAHAADNDRARDRRRGYEAALRGARRKVDASLCVETALDIASGARAFGELVERRPDLRAVFCSADAIAIGALHECHRRRLAVPRRIAIAGFDDIPIAGHARVGLTTVHQDAEHMGGLAAEMLLQAIAAGRHPSRRVVLPTELVIRTSTGPAPEA